MTAKVTDLLICFLATIGVAQGALNGGPKAVTDLRNSSDVVIVASIKSITDTVSAETLQLQVHSVLKGQVSSLTIMTELEPPVEVGMPKSGLLSKDSIGAAGVWFLNLGPSGYKVAPLASGVYTDRDFFVPVVDFGVPIAAGENADQQLLWYLVRWYRSLSNPNPGDDARLFKSLDRSERADALMASNILINSGSIDHMAVSRLRFGADRMMRFRCWLTKSNW